MHTAIQVNSVGAGVYQAIQREIVQLTMPPGTRLRLDAMAVHFGVSHTPVREALQRLRSEGLVEFVPRRGARVASLSYAELEEIQAIRLGVECRLARYGAVGATVASLKLASTRHRKLVDTLKAKDLDGYIRAYQVFRDGCYEQAGRPRLLNVVREQRARAERYLRFLCRDAGALLTSSQHQVEFLKACEANDGAAAEIATKQALSWSLRRLGELLHAYDFGDKDT